MPPWIWQCYLAKEKAYTGALDGYFGTLSQKALLAVTGEKERNIKAWNQLFTLYGILEQ